MRTWAGLNGRGCPFPSSIPVRNLKTKGNRDRIRGGCKIRVGGHLMPENPGVTPSPSIAKCWYWVESENGSQRAASSLMQRSYPQPQGPLYLNLFI